MVLTALLKQQPELIPTALLRQPPTIPYRAAVICVNCEVVYDMRDGSVCPVCQSVSRFHLAKRDAIKS